MSYLVASEYMICLVVIWSKKESDRTHDLAPGRFRFLLTKLIYTLKRGLSSEKSIIFVDFFEIARFQPQKPFPAREKSNTIDKKAKSVVLSNTIDKTDDCGVK